MEGNEHKVRKFVSDSALDDLALPNSPGEETLAHRPGFGENIMFALKICAMGMIHGIHD